jgi:hypothetical protein
MIEPQNPHSPLSASPLLSSRPDTKELLWAKICPQQVVDHHIKHGGEIYGIDSSLPDIDVIVIFSAFDRYNHQFERLWKNLAIFT